MIIRQSQVALTVLKIKAISLKDNFKNKIKGPMGILSAATEQPTKASPAPASASTPSFQYAHSDAIPYNIYNPAILRPHVLKSAVGFNSPYRAVQESFSIEHYSSNFPLTALDKTALRRKPRRGQLAGVAEKDGKEEDNKRRVCANKNICTVDELRFGLANYLQRLRRLSTSTLINECTQIVVRYVAADEKNFAPSFYFQTMEQLLISMLVSHVVLMERLCGEDFNPNSRFCYGRIRQNVFSTYAYLERHLYARFGLPFDAVQFMRRLPGLLDATPETWCNDLAAMVTDIQTMNMGQGRQYMAQYKRNARKLRGRTGLSKFPFYAVRRNNDLSLVIRELGSDEPFDLQIYADHCYSPHGLKTLREWAGPPTTLMEIEKLHPIFDGSDFDPNKPDCVETLEKTAMAIHEMTMNQLVLLCHDSIDYYNDAIATQNSRHLKSRYLLLLLLDDEIQLRLASPRCPFLPNLMELELQIPDGLTSLRGHIFEYRGLLGLSEDTSRSIAKGRAILSVWAASLGILSKSSKKNKNRTDIDAVRAHKAVRAGRRR